MKEGFKNWVVGHSINGPSDVAFEVKKTERFVQLFLAKENNTWMVINNLVILEESRKYQGEYFIVFRSELNKFLRDE